MHHPTRSLAALLATTFPLLAPIFAQGYALALGANAAGLLTSNALALSLGL